MKRLVFWFFACFVGACSSTPSTDTVVPDVHSDIGINLAAINYYATQTPFADVFRLRDDWATTDGVTFDTQLADSIPVDADGYPLAIPALGQMMRASVFQPFEAGTFTLTWEGEGDLTVQGPSLKLLSTGTRSLKFSLGKTVDEPLFVRIERSSAADHVHNIRVVADGGYEAAFSNAMKGFSVVRFMDWGETNANPIAQWSERTTSLQAQGTVRGAAIETMIETANKLKAAMWYSVPHMADDDFVERAAQLIKQRLASDLKVYIEYSNENWNPIFPQVEWEGEQGLAEGLDADAAPDDSEASRRYDAGLKFSIRRAARVHSTFRRVLGAARVVRVVSGQSGSPTLNDALLSLYEDAFVNPLGGRPDALAVAPYFGRIYSPDDTTDAEVANMSVDDVLSDAESRIETSVAEDTRANRKIADEHAVELVAYEAGQHLLAIGGLENNPAFVARLIAANRDPRMGDLYRKAHAAWIDNGGGIAIYFNSCQTPSKYGTWGALEYQNQPVAKSPKMAALKSIAGVTPD